LLEPILAFVLIEILFHTLSSLKSGLDELSVKYPTFLTDERINTIVSWFDTIDWKKTSSKLSALR